MIELSLTFQLPEDEIQTMIQHSIDSMVDESLDGKTWTIDEFRKNCCANKSAEWVRRFIFLKFSDEIDYRNYGWVINPKGGRGKKQIIFAKPALPVNGWKKIADELIGMQKFERWWL